MSSVFLRWEIGAYDAPTVHTSTMYRVPHLSDSGVTILFSGSGFTYDAGNIPTGGVISSIRLMAGGVTLARLTSVDIDMAAYGDLVRDYLDVRGQISWTNLLGAELDVVSITATNVRVANTDGTFTDVVGTGLGAPSPGQITGSVSLVRHVAADGATIITSVGVNASLAVVASALDESTAATVLFMLINQGNNALAGLNNGINIDGTTYFYDLEAGPGNDSINGSTIRNVDYDYAIAGVTVNLVNGAATGGGGTDSLALIQGVSGSIFNDTITGNASINTLHGRDGDDLLSGSGGNDELDGGIGDDTVNGGGGVDTAHYEDSDIASGVNVSLMIAGAQNTGGAGIDTLIAIENLYGSQFGDQLTGNTAANALYGAGGNDKINGGDRADSLDGGAGNDVLNGGSGADALRGQAGADKLNGGGGVDTAFYDGVTAGGVSVSLAVFGAQNTGGAGTDTLAGIENLSGSQFVDTLTGDGGNNLLQGNGGADTLRGSGGDDTLQGGDGSDSLYGGNGDDVLLGLNHNDALNGGAGADHMEGGIGNDNLAGGDGVDTAYYFDGIINGVTVSLVAPGAQNTGAAGIDTLSGIENIFGSNFGDALIGDQFANVLTGNGGADILDGNDGQDQLFGGVENDILIGGAGDDLLRGEDGSDVLRGGIGDDSLRGDAGQDFFVFDTGLGVDVDTILSFDTNEDRIYLDAAVFTGLSLGALSAAAFRTGNSDFAADADDRIIYNAFNGHLLFDPDGIGGTDAELFALLLVTPPISAFEVI